MAFDIIGGLKIVAMAVLGMVSCLFIIIALAVAGHMLATGDTSGTTTLRDDEWVCWARSRHTGPKAMPYERCDAWVRKGIGQ